MKNKLFMAGMVTTIATMGAVSVVEADSLKFSDVKEGNSHYGAIMELSQRGIIHGYPDGTFKPNEVVTQSQAAKMVAGVIGLKGSEQEIVATLKQKGILEKSFKMNTPVTRYQMATMITKALQLPTSDTITNTFTDVATEYQQAVETLFVNHITTGTTATTFSGEKFVTRGQLASFIVRAEQRNMVEIMEAKLTIEAIQQGKLTAAGREWTVAKNVQTLLNEQNTQALAGARIQVVIIDNQIVDVLAIALNASGAKGKNVVFDGANSTFAGNLFVNADFVELKNITVTQNIVVTPKASTNLAMSKLRAENFTIIYDQQSPVTASLTKVKLANTVDTVFEISSVGSSATNLYVLPNNPQDDVTTKLAQLAGLDMWAYDNQFTPAASITRQELATIFAWAPKDDAGLSFFVDAPVGGWTAGFVEVAKKEELVIVGGELPTPPTQITKEQLAEIVVIVAPRQNESFTGFKKNQKQISFTGDFLAGQLVFVNPREHGILSRSDVRLSGNMNDIMNRLIAPTREIVEYGNSSSQAPTHIEALNTSIRLAKEKLQWIEQLKQNGVLILSADGQDVPNIPKEKQWLPEMIVVALQAQVMEAEQLANSQSLIVEPMITKLNGLTGNIKPRNGLKEIVGAQQKLANQQLVIANEGQIFAKIAEILEETQVELQQEQIRLEGNQVTVTLHEAIECLNPSTMTMVQFIPAITAQLTIVRDITITDMQWTNDGLLLTTTADSAQLTIGTELTLILQGGQTLSGTVATADDGSGIIIRFENIPPNVVITAIEAEGYRFTILPTT
ncbi:S-layer homology domain-containing protein [Lysinibacillus sp. NPDC047702]|uniref:S-layer homology domain-containing protein n=1 Tax=unclassified Lysinibacillus TaxID=2636778 RepID=UPI003D07D26F